MTNPRLAGRYAKSLIDIAQEKNVLDATYNDVTYLQSVIAQSREFANMLRSPIIKADKKIAVLTAITAGKTGVIINTFNNLLISKNREAKLAEILQAFVEQYDVIKGINKVNVTSASELSDANKKAITERLEKEAGLTNIELIIKVDPKLIGGFILEYNNSIVDASILRDLKDIKKQFSQNVYVNAIR